MGDSLRLDRLDRRIAQSKRRGKLVLGGVLLVSLVFGATLIQGLLLALEAGKGDLILRAWIGLGLLAGLVLFAAFLIRRQHRRLDEAREDLVALIRGDPPI
jgi:hypothetical protein